MIGLLVSALVYKVKTGRLISESVLYGTAVFLSIVGIQILTRLVTLPSLLVNDYVLLPLSYFVASFIWTYHSRFRYEQRLSLSLWIAGIVLLIKIGMASLSVFAAIGVTI